jgi:hypothetical protein
MTVYGHGFGVERLPPSVALQEGISCFQWTAIENNAERPDHFSGQETMKGEGEIVRGIQYRPVAAGGFKPVEVFPDNRCSVALLFEKIKGLCR